MAGPEQILARVRSYGANVVLGASGLQIVNKAKLPAEAFPLIRQHRREIAALLEQETAEAIEERAAIVEFDGNAPRSWAEQFARILYTQRPNGVSDLDWSWFISTCGRIIDEAPARAGQ